MHHAFVEAGSSLNDPLVSRSTGKMFVCAYLLSAYLLPDFFRYSRPEKPQRGKRKIERRTRLSARLHNFSSQDVQYELYSSLTSVSNAPIDLQEAPTVGKMVQTKPPLYIQ
ncbi:unnamed protein product, partial [Scytosiphon promiscuus]